jgi:hypothetical protein
MSCLVQRYSTMEYHEQCGAHELIVEFGVKRVFVVYKLYPIVQHVRSPTKSVVERTMTAQGD